MSAEPMLDIENGANVARFLQSVQPLYGCEYSNDARFLHGDRLIREFIAAAVLGKDAPCQSRTSPMFCTSCTTSSRSTARSFSTGARLTADTCRSSNGSSAACGASHDRARSLGLRHARTCLEHA